MSRVLMGNEAGGLRRNARLQNGGSGKEHRTYRVRSKISASELAIVYAGRCEKQEIKCVIKEFYPKSLVRRGKDGSSVRRLSGMPDDKYEALRDAFINEGELLKACEHPGIVRCIDQFEQNDTVYIVMEFIEGVTLAEMIGGRPDKIEPGFLYKTMLPLIETLEHLHKQGIIHRDLKPGNIMIDRQGNAKLLDFGSAVRFDGSGGHPILTTAGYSPLELYSEQSRQGPVSDIYSLAAVLFYCCRGTAPTDVRKRLFDDRLEPIHAGLKRRWPFLSRAIRRGLIVAPDKRCTSLKWFKAAITMEYVTSPSARRKSRSG
ncbi:serine/threonine-protein kinase [Paenibacillus bouchesdurhonensis]|uniref:serine/threonine-protein kinase n=1 Tax=Paenibacillus bouchesdurhonensis TaxID=1870990 RepID=UPI001F423CDE|nr:serine/threonine-protein kinase [Paenibacillus bouchesdurhonensis]